MRVNPTIACVYNCIYSPTLARRKYSQMTWGWEIKRSVCCVVCVKSLAKIQIIKVFLRSLNLQCSFSGLRGRGAQQAGTPLTF